MAADTSKITGAADDLSDKLTKGGSAAKTLGAEIANAFNALDARITALEAGVGTQPPIEPPVEPPTNAYGKIENFTATNGAQFKIDGKTAANCTCNKAHCLNQVDDYTLRFEIRQGDVWAAAGGSYADSGVNRCEVDFMSHLMNEGAMTGWEGTVTVLPGPAMTAGFFQLVQSHATTNVNPTYAPFTIQLEEDTERLIVVLQEPNNGWNRVYRSPNAVARGQPMRLRASVKMRPAGNGYVGVWWDDNQIVDFNGRVGATNSQYYWKYGPYRTQVAETMQVEFKNVHIITG